MSKEKFWVYAPKKIIIKAPENEKEKMNIFFFKYSQEVLSPKLPKIKEGKLFQYTHFYGIWRRSYFYMGIHVKDTRDDVLDQEYDDPRIRLEYRGPGMFLCSYMRHTNEWQELTYGKPETLEECLLLAETFLAYM